MKIQVLSDIHTEFFKDGALLPFTVGEGVDYVILAGDLTTYTPESINILTNWIKKYPEVTFLVIAGNHDFYHGDFDYDRFKERYEDCENVVVLQDSSLVDLENNVQFLGCTLWTHLNPMEEYMAKRSMSDFRIIKGLTPSLTNKAHLDSVNFLTESLMSKTFEGFKKVVISHHTPSNLSTPERFKNDSLNCCFSNNLEELIIGTHPELWIHGHTHDSMDYMIEDTRVLCNPFGYVKYEKNPNFINELIVEL